MGLAFTPQANFRNMCHEEVWIDRVKQKTFVEVNEEGTEASAVTVVKMKRGGIVNILFNRPFFLAIRDNTTGLILFMGSIIKP